MSVAPGPRLGSGRAAEVFEYGSGRVIKLLREPGRAEWFAREAAAQSTVRAAGILAPAVFGMEEFDGRSGIVMERIDGVDCLTAMQRAPWRIWSIGRAVGRLHRQLEAVAAPPDLRTVREVVMRRIDSSPRIPAAALERLRAIAAVAPDGDRLCHLDFHPGNVIESPTGLVVIDFSNAASGHPAADYARSVMTFQAGQPADDTPARDRFLIAIGRRLAGRAYVSGYGPPDRQAVSLWMPLVVAARLDEGIPQERKRLLRMLSRTLRAAETITGGRGAPTG